MAARSRHPQTKNETLRRRYGKANAPERISHDDPKYADLRKQLQNSALASDEEVQAHLRWLESDDP